MVTDEDREYFNIKAARNVSLRDDGITPIWSCKLCGIGLDYSYDRSFNFCLDHKDTLEAKALEDAENEAFEKKQIEEFKEELEECGRITHDTEAVCPYCFKVGSDTWDYNMQDDQTTEVSCGHCSEKFSLSLSISTTYTARKMS